MRNEELGTRNFHLSTEEKEKRRKGEKEKSIAGRVVPSAPLPLFPFSLLHQSQKLGGNSEFGTNPRDLAK
jgi:hypothetical protein